MKDEIPCKTCIALAMCVGRAKQCGSMFDLLQDQFIEMCPDIKLYYKEIKYEKPENTDTKTYYGNQWIVKDVSQLNKRLNVLFTYLRNPLDD